MKIVLLQNLYNAIPAEEVTALRECVEGKGHTLLFWYYNPNYWVFDYGVLNVRFRYESPSLVLAYGQTTPLALAMADEHSLKAFIWEAEADFLSEDQKKNSDLLDFSKRNLAIPTKGVMESGSTALRDDSPVFDSTILIRNTKKNSKQFEEFNTIALKDKAPIVLSKESQVLKELSNLI